MDTEMYLHNILKELKESKQEIKRLKDENEKFKSDCFGKDVDIRHLKKENEKITRENTLLVEGNNLLKSKHAKQVVILENKIRKAEEDITNKKCSKKGRKEDCYVEIRRLKRVIDKQKVFIEEAAKLLHFDKDLLVEIVNLQNVSVNDILEALMSEKDVDLVKN